MGQFENFKEILHRLELLLLHGGRMEARGKPGNRHWGLAWCKYTLEFTSGSDLKCVASVSSSRDYQNREKDFILGK